MRFANIVVPVILLSLAVLLAPVLLAAIPPMQDYPNHLSRIWLLSGGWRVPALAGMYRLNFDTLTNIGIDLLAVGLTRFLSYEIVGRLLVAATVLLAPLGGVLLWRVLHGRWHWWQLSFGLLAWSIGVILGFLNFEIGLGLALLAAAADPGVSRRGAIATALVRVVFGILLMLMHAFALVFYAALLCGITLGPHWRDLVRREALLRAGRSIVVIAVTLAVPVALMFALAPSLPGQQEGTTLHSAWGEFLVGLSQLQTATSYKFNRIFLGIIAYAPWLDILTLAALVTPVLLAQLFGRLRVHAGMLLVVVGLLVCYVLCPRDLAGANWVDVRFVLMAPFVLAAALQPDLPRRSASAVATAVLAASLLRTGFVGWVWHERQVDVASLSRALAAVPPGAAILPLRHEVLRSGNREIGRYASIAAFSSYWNMPVLALPWRHAFVPTLFASRGKQPVEVLPPWNEIAEPDGGMLPSVHALDMQSVYRTALLHAPYLSFWRDRFDYALVVGADDADRYGPFVPPAGMTLVDDEGFAQLYRFDRAVLQSRR